MIHGGKARSLDEVEGFKRIQARHIELKQVNRWSGKQIRETYQTESEWVWRKTFFFNKRNWIFSGRIWNITGLDLLGSSDGKESAYNARDLGLIPGSGRSRGEGNGSPLQYPCLENSMDRETWWAIVLGGHKESGTTEQLTFSLSDI